MYQSIHICGEELWLYNILLGLGILAALLYLVKEIETRRYFRHEAALMTVLTVSVLAGIAGAHVAEQIVQQRPLTWENLVYGGSTFLGGLLAGGTVFLLGIRITRQRLFPVLCMSIPAVPLAHAFGRIGCFLGGCCYGAPAPKWIGVVYPPDSEAFARFGPQPLYPTQLFEAALNFLLFWILFRRTPFRYRPSVYLVGYGAGRFLLEFLRADSRGDLLPGLSFSQWIGLAMMLSGYAVWRNVRLGRLRAGE